MDYVDLLIEGAKIYGIELNNTQVKQFMKYKELLKEWNEKINLTAITDDEGIIKKHFIDSISILNSGVIKDNISVIDVGTGAGFPGIPIKIIMPSVRVVLLDSLNKRINFLNTVISELGLSGIEAVHGRAEDFARKDKFRESFDIATARAVANLAVLSEYCIPYVKVGGYFVALKGPAAQEELSESKNAIGTLGGKFLRVVETKIPEEEIKHNLVVVEKLTATQDKYPRKAGQIEKKPIK
jgi:16S rRNA (guanine527-N7)-methyltransferase